MTLPNKVTVARLGLALVTFACLWSQRPNLYIAAFVFCAIAVATDWVDGWLARRRGETSPFGAVVDPLADKVLIIGCLIAFVRDPNVEVPSWVVFLIIVRELLIGGLRGLAALQGVLIAADRGGKWKMGVQSAVVLILLALTAGRSRGILPAPERGDPESWALSALALAVSLWSGAVYFYNGRQVLRRSWNVQKPAP
ncbi:MAG: CDP-diacylglycerol--glycerol-3-phosphate 3-phosphatidyltransferase [Elusimicrobia bacterium]|nr:CDP-diacylglycerol--glycerol-3-phosphate 3-phosphatidyltransferase [Elusimicrobiota bacterium]